jgi:dTDP-4-dehydrorhamnose reductase
VKYVVFGSGLLAQEVAHVARSSGSDVLLLSRSLGVDITDLDQLFAASLTALGGTGYSLPLRAIFNCAAYTAVDKAQDEPSLAQRVNAVGAENVALLANAYDCPLVHFSTDAVFSYEQMKFCVPDELLEPQDPPSAYGRSKLLGEHLVRRAKPDAHILRVASLYGDAGRNWASKLRDRLVAGEQIEADILRRVGPTWARWVAEVALHLLQTPGGVYHASASGECSWADFADELVSKAGSARDAADSAHIVTNAQVRRVMLRRRAPLTQRGLLASALLPLRGVDVPTWNDLLSRYLKEERTCTGS